MAGQIIKRGVVTFDIHAPNSKTGVFGERSASGDN
jgi:hypothetical protein